MDSVLDQYLARFQNLPSFNIHRLDADGLRTVPWYEVQMADVVRELVLDELNLPFQVQAITAQIQLWGRLESLARRVWQVEERRYRVWKAGQYLEAKGGKVRVTDAAIEARYRTHEEYASLQNSLERAEEAFNAVHAVLEAFRAKKSILERFAYRRHEDGMPSLSL